MTILDRYIIRQFIMAFLFGMVAVLLVFVVIDMMEKLDDFIDANVPTEKVIRYYVAFMPEIVKLMTPVAMLLAALFVTGRLTNQNELTAMRSSGVSLYRLLLPFLAVSLLVSVASVFFSGWIVPKANQHKFSIEREYLHRATDAPSRFNIYFQDGRSRTVSIGYYDVREARATRVSIEEFSESQPTQFVRRYDARTMEWVAPSKQIGDTAFGGWVLVNGSKREFGPDGETMTLFEREPIGKLTLNPEEIRKKQMRPDEMNYTELSEFITQQKRAGQDASRWLVDLHAKIAFPFASFIVVLFGVPFGAGRRRSGVAIEFGICVAVTFIYLTFMKTSQVFGYNGDLDPLFTAWLANILFLTAALLNILRASK